VVQRSKRRHREKGGGDEGAETSTTEISKNASGLEEQYHEHEHEDDGGGDKGGGPQGAGAVPRPVKTDDFEYWTRNGRPTGAYQAVTFKAESKLDNIR
jgi:hypothetical protein